MTDELVVTLGGVVAGTLRRRGSSRYVHTNGRGRVGAGERA